MAKDSQDNHHHNKKDDMDDEEDDSKIFPQRLMEILGDEDNHDAICWLPHGRAFIIRKRDLFAEKVMPKYFSRKAKYSSFTRKLNRWNFVRVSSGPELGAYYHEFFLRDKPHLAAQMFCKNARTMLAMASGGESPAHAPMAAPEGVSAAAALSVNTTPAAVAAAAAAASLTAATSSLSLNNNSAAAASLQIPVTPALLAALTKDPAPANNNNNGKGHSAQSMMGYAPTNIRLLEMHIMQQEQANRILLEHAMALSVQQRQEQQAKLANEQARLIQMRQLMQLRQQQTQNRNPTNPRASAA